MPRPTTRPAAAPEPTSDAERLAVVDRLYTALGACDGDAMAACYEPDARFSDPVFAELRGAQVGGMWRMLTSRAADLRLARIERAATPGGATARWEAHYTFSETGRPVVNRVRSELRFGPRGLIAEQRDDFDFHRWARQALGAPGLLLGWLPPMRAAVGRKALAGLDAYMAGT